MRAMEWFLLALPLLVTGFEQMTYTRPCRFWTTRQRSHIGLTEGRTFMTKTRRSTAAPQATSS